MTIAKKPRISPAAGAAEEKKTRKTPARKTKPEVVITLQYMGFEMTSEAIVQRVKEAWAAEGGDESAIKKMELYVKPEDRAVYYVINGSGEGKVEL